MPTTEHIGYHTAQTRARPLYGACHRRTGSWTPSGCILTGRFRRSPIRGFPDGLELDETLRCARSSGCSSGIRWRGDWSPGASDALARSRSLPPPAAAIPASKPCASANAWIWRDFPARPAWTSTAVEGSARLPELRFFPPAGHAGHPVANETAQHVLLNRQRPLDAETSFTVFDLLEGMG